MPATSSRDVPVELLGAPLERARTLPGRWYADPAHHELRAGRRLPPQLGRAPAAPTTSPHPARIWRPASAGSPCSSCVTTPASCGRSSTSAATAARRWPRAVAAPARCRVRTTPGCTGSTARWPAPVASARRSTSTPADFALRPVQVTTFARSVMVNVDPDAAPFDAGPLAAGLDAVPARRAGARRAHPLRAALQLEGPARELLRELPHALHPLAAPDRRLRVPDRVRRTGRVRLGPAARAARTRPSGRSTITARVSPVGRPSPTSPPTIRSTTAATWRCSPTRRSRASPASPPRSG